MGYSLVQWAYIVVAIIAIIMLIGLYLKANNINPPPLFIQAVWIVLGAIIIIGAIFLIARFAGLG